MVKDSVQISSTAAANGSQSATDPMIVAADVAEKKPKSMDNAADKTRVKGFER